MSPALPTRRYPTQAHTSLPPIANYAATIASPIFPLPLVTSHHYANAVIDPVTGISLKYWHLSTGPTKEKWIQRFTNELSCLANGIGKHMPTGTGTIRYTSFS
jgi:hypothetical protein